MAEVGAHVLNGIPLQLFLGLAAWEAGLSMSFLVFAGRSFPSSLATYGFHLARLCVELAMWRGGAVVPGKSCDAKGLRGPVFLAFFSAQAGALRYPGFCLRVGPVGLILDPFLAGDLRGQPAGEVSPDRPAMGR